MRHSSNFCVVSSLLISRMTTIIWTWRTTSSTLHCVDCTGLGQNSVEIRAGRECSSCEHSNFLSDSLYRAWKINKYQWSAYKFIILFYWSCLFDSSYEPLGLSCGAEQERHFNFMKSSTAWASSLFFWILIMKLKCLLFFAYISASHSIDFLSVIVFPWHKWIFMIAKIYNIFFSPVNSLRIIVVAHCMQSKFTVDFSSA